MIQDEILDLLSDGEFHSAVEINNIGNHSISGLRQCRKLREKGYVIEKRVKPRSNQHYEYRLAGERTCFA